ncbi:MAG: hypothetical protein KAZ87_06990 [Spirochaetes bacterium]|nr:hypothetical protein [Spirochaetota bacterium]
MNKRIESILKDRLNSSIYEYGFADLSGLLSGRYKPLSYGKSIFNPSKCREYCRQKTKESIGVDNSLCGKCISVCPMGGK